MRFPLMKFMPFHSTPIIFPSFLVTYALTNTHYLLTPPLMHFPSTYTDNIQLQINLPSSLWNKE